MHTMMEVGYWMAVKPVNENHHLSRLVPRSKQATNEKGDPIGVTWAAFELRPKEEYLSTNCLEVESADRLTALKAILVCLNRKLGTKSGILAVGNVKAIKETFLPHKIRVTSEGKASDPSYSAVRRYPPKLERQLYLERLAAGAWSSWTSVEELENDVSNTQDSVPDS